MTEVQRELTVQRVRQEVTDKQYVVLTAEVFMMILIYLSITEGKHLSVIIIRLSVEGHLTVKDDDNPN